MRYLLKRLGKAIAGIVYPCFIQAGDHIVSKTHITKYDIMLFQVNRDIATALLKIPLNAKLCLIQLEFLDSAFACPSDGHFVGDVAVIAFSPAT